MIRESWEVDTSIRLRTMSWYLSLLSLKENTEEYKKLAITWNKDLHVWAMTHIIQIASKVKRKDRPARVKVDQEILDEIEKITGIKAIEFQEVK